jgi:hypothetical protein
MRNRLVRFVGLTIASVVLAVTLTVLWALAPWLLPPSLPPLPPPPAVAAAPGPLPGWPVAFDERITRADAFERIGMGFLLRLPGGDVVGVTTAHSLGGHDFAPIRFTYAGEAIAASFANLHAPLGTARTGSDLTVDYVLMRPDAPPDPAHVLEPDPRGAPQLGERVALYAGVKVLDGTVESVDAQGAWIRMDDWAQMAGLSGSPVVSRHTGKVVGMAIGINTQGGALRLGINPIGSILNVASR